MKIIRQKQNWNHPFEVTWTNPHVEIVEKGNCYPTVYLCESNNPDSPRVKLGKYSTKEAAEIVAKDLKLILLNDIPEFIQMPKTNWDESLPDPIWETEFELTIALVETTKGDSSTYRTVLFADKPTTGYQIEKEIFKSGYTQTDLVNLINENPDTCEFRVQYVGRKFTESSALSCDNFE